MGSDGLRLADASTAEGSEHLLIVCGNSWYVGANIPGKPRVVSPFTGSNVMYRERCNAVVKANYEGLEFSG